MLRTGYAEQVCLQCKKQKRKCDRILPSCSLCARLDRTCRYESLEKASSASTQPALAQSGLLPDPSRAITLQDVFDIIRAQYTATTGDETKALQEASRYFKTVHSWFPVLDPILYYEQLSSAWSLQRAEFLLLTLCISLINALPNGTELAGQTLSLYTFVKGYIGVFDSIGPNSLELIQSRLLITMFESGHGMHQAAYISIGSTIRAAVALGLDRTRDTPQASPELQRKVEEERRVWLGVVILDRYTALDMRKRSSEFCGMTSLKLKSTTEMRIEEGLPSSISSPESQFSMLFHASRILDQVLAHVYDPTPQDEFNTTEAMHIFSTLKSFQAVLKERVPGEAVLYSASTALCESASLVLIQSWIHLERPDKERCATSSKSILGSAVEEVLTHSSFFEQGSLLRNLEAVPIFVLHPIYEAASILAHELKYTDTLDATKGVATLMSMLTGLSRRWVSGRRYLELLNKYFLRD